MAAPPRLQESVDSGVSVIEPCAASPVATTSAGSRDGRGPAGPGASPGEGQGKGEQLLQRERKGEPPWGSGERREGEEKGAVSRNNNEGGAVGEGGGAD